MYQPNKQSYNNEKKTYPEHRQTQENNFKECDTDNEKKNRFRKTNEFIDYKFGTEDYGPFSDDNKVVIPIKPCSKCSKILKLTEYNKSCVHKDGHKPYCRECESIMRMFVRQKYKECNLRASLKWKAKNKRKQYDYVNKYKRKMRALKSGKISKKDILPTGNKQAPIIPLLPHQEFREIK